MRIGVVSDTHGYLHPSVINLLRGVECILHAGDIGGEDIIEALAQVAPVTAVRGNNDRQGPTSLYPAELTLELGSRRVLLTHQVKLPRRTDGPDMEPYGNSAADVVVFGHSHIACIEWRGQVLFFNPGAAGKRRFNTIPSIGILTLEGDRVHGAIIPL